MDVKNKIIVVTGAASGIGAACSEYLNKLGAKVIGMDRAFEDSSNPSGTWLSTIQFDQGDHDSIKAVLSKLPNNIDGLLNVAGVAPSSRFSPTDVLRINFYGLRKLTLSLLPIISEGGAIVNMSSGTGAGWMSNLDMLRQWLKIENLQDVEAMVEQDIITNDGTGNTSAYPLSKQLLNVWTMQMASICRPKNLRINAVASAAVETPIMNDFLDSFGAEAAARLESFGSATPESVANAAVFLLSNQSNWINGALLPVDAGAVATGTIKKLDLSLS